MKHKKNLLKGLANAVVVMPIKAPFILTSCIGIALTAFALGTVDAAIDIFKNS